MGIKFNLLFVIHSVEKIEEIDDFIQERIVIYPRRYPTTLNIFLEWE